jgi:hypothetical protein
MTQDEYQKIIASVERAMNENIGNRINEYTGTGILSVIAREVSVFVEDDCQIEDPQAY